MVDRKISGSEKFEAPLEIQDLDEVKRHVDLHEVDDTDVDPVTFEVLSHRFSQLTEEMGSTVKNVSGSVVATDANDFQTTVGDEKGNLVEIGPYMLFFTGVTDRVAKWVLDHRAENPGINPGDQFLCNDPWIATMHQSDVSLAKPIFWEGELFGWATSIIHQVDVGGYAPGSFTPQASDVFAEGDPIPPVKIVDQHDIRSDVEDAYLRRSRNPPELALDLRAKRAANNLAEERIHEMIEEYGADTVKKVMKRDLEYTEERFRNKLSAYPDGVWSHEHYIEAAKTEDRGVYRSTLEMEIDGDELTFRVSGDESVGMINCTMSGFVGGTTSAILPLMAHDLPWSLTSYVRHINYEADDDIIVNADFPAGVSMGTVSGTFHVHNSAAACINKMLGSSEEYKDDIAAGGCGCWPTENVMGTDRQGRTFATMIMDMMSGGYGATPNNDGVNSAGNPYAPRGMCPSIERNEVNVPMLYLYRREIQDSGGAGEYRGGAGVEICYLPHDVGGPDGDPTDAELDSAKTCMGTAFPPTNGIGGGMPPNSALYKGVRDSGVQEDLRAGDIPQEIEHIGDVELYHPKLQTVQGGDDVFYISWPGGGGYGDPLDRDPDAVLADVVDEYVSKEAARDLYGVVIDGQGVNAAVDEAATEQRRDDLREQRLANASFPGGGDR